MHQTAIFGPFFATMFLTFVVWVYMYARRIPLIRGSGLTPGELAIPGRLAEISPAQVSNPSDNLKNLFEIPVLFYAPRCGSCSFARRWRRSERREG